MRLSEYQETGSGAMVGLAAARLRIEPLIHSTTITRTSRRVA